MLTAPLAVELLFKRHFWVVHLVFLLGVCLLVMRTANAFVEKALTPLPDSRPRVAARAVAPEQLAALNGDNILPEDF